MTQTLHPLSRTRLEALLEAISQTVVLVVGDVMLDRYLMGDVERISPEAPVPIVTVVDEHAVPGGAANVAANLAALGASPRLHGVVGDDAAGDALREALAARAIPTNGVLTQGGRPTTTKTRIVARGQQVVRIDLEVTTALPDRTRELLLEAVLAAMPACGAVVLEDYDKGVMDPALAAAVIAAATAQGIPVVVDPKQRNFFGYAGATVFKPNRRELEQALGTHFAGDDRDLADARIRLGAEHLLLTLGAEGMALVSADAPLRRTPSIAREVFDVSGAGDTVTAWLGAALAAGAEITEAVWMANLAAGVEVGKQGTATVSADEVMAAWEEEVGDDR
ncbi:MAG: D-glycero-beta-D-manno-heptose-7-phosphate kinase [Gemmatimonadetes bacterium]|nr:D-glycero-beta-D-manno-heptose-7-phosphate kinase [Gemmatimonadota bacterium]